MHHSTTMSPVTIITILTILGSAHGALYNCYSLLRGDFLGKNTVCASIYPRTYIAEVGLIVNVCEVVKTYKPGGDSCEFEDDEEVTVCNWKSYRRIQVHNYPYNGTELVWAQHYDEPMNYTRTTSCIYKDFEYDCDSLACGKKPHVKLTYLTGGSPYVKFEERLYTYFPREAELVARNVERKVVTERCHFLRIYVTYKTGAGFLHLHSSGIGWCRINGRNLPYEKNTIWPLSDYINDKYVNCKCNRGYYKIPVITNPEVPFPKITVKYQDKTKKYSLRSRMPMVMPYQKEIN